MIHIKRKVGEKIEIGDGITIVVLEGCAVKLGVDAPKHIRIRRSASRPSRTARRGLPVKETLAAVGANATAGSVTISRDYTRILDITDVTAGTFRFEYDLSSWDMNDTPGLNATTDQEGITFQIRDSAGDSVNLVAAIAASDTQFRIRQAVNNGSIGATAGQDLFALTGSDLLVWAEGDLATGIFTSGYNDGTGDTTLISDGTGLTDIAQIRLAVEGTNPWSATDSIGLDFVTLDVTAVPEPSSFALVCVAGLAMVGRRRKRKLQDA